MSDNVTREVIEGQGTIIRVPMGEGKEDQIIWVPNEETTQPYIPGADWQAAGDSYIREAQYQNNLLSNLDAMGLSPTALGVRSAERALDKAERAERGIPLDDSSRYTRPSAPADPVSDVPEDGFVGPLPQGGLAPTSGIGSIIGTIGNLQGNLQGNLRDRAVTAAKQRVQRAQDNLTAAQTRYNANPASPRISTERPTWSSNPSLKEARGDYVPPASLPSVSEISDEQWLQYGVANPDLLQAGLNTPEELKSHWENHGESEGRQFTTPDWDYQRYLINNPDLIQAGNKTNLDALSHYARFGWAEGEEGRDYTTDNFDYNKYLFNYGDLGQFGYDKRDLQQHYINHGFNEGRIHDMTLADFQNYGASNPDVYAAWAAQDEEERGDFNAFAGRHYNLHGKSEGRRTDTFSPWNYLASNTDLIDAFKDEADKESAARRHYLEHGIGEERNPGGFNWENYLANYGDLREAFGDDQNAAMRHYVESGYGEGRTAGDLPEPLPDNFNWQGYVINNPDLLNAGIDTVEEARDHYLTHGQTEGRDYTTDNFDETTYANRYSDLQEAFGNDETALQQHYIDSGFNEGRTDVGNLDNYGASNLDVYDAWAAQPEEVRGDFNEFAARHYNMYGRPEGRSADTFNPYNYLATNPDLMDAFGADTSAAREHYLGTGRGEERNPGGFDAARYLDNYGDLKDAFGTDENAAIEHYVRHGYGEGRTAGDLPTPTTPTPTPTPTPTNPEFNWQSYGENYDDLGRSAGWDEANLQQQLTDHYNTYGKDEGRTDLDWRNYGVNYKDLSEAGLTDRDSLLEHYRNYGKAEGRTDTPTFNVDQYRSNYGDLAEAYGSGEGSSKNLLEHYLKHGRGEDRSDINWQAYVNEYPDLREAGIDTVEEARDHWRDYGQAEGRKNYTGYSWV